MKQDQSYFEQVFYLREGNFGLKIKKNVALKITCKIVAFVCQKLSFIDMRSVYHSCSADPLITIFHITIWLIDRVWLEKPHLKKLQANDLHFLSSRGGLRGKAMTMFKHRLPLLSWWIESHRVWCAQNVNTHTHSLRIMALHPNKCNLQPSYVLLFGNN